MVYVHDREIGLDPDCDVALRKWPGQKLDRFMGDGPERDILRGLMIFPTRDNSMRSTRSACIVSTQS